MLHWRLLMAALVLTFALGLTLPFAGLTGGPAWAGDPDDPYVPDEDPDDP